MLFNSFGFLFVFLPSTLVLGRFFLKYFGERGYAVFLSAASLLFLWLNDHHSVSVLFLSIIANYLFLNFFNLRFVALPVILNLALLSGFKYFNLWSIHSGLTIPLGLSFYTFQQIGYLIDESESNKRQKLSFWNYFLSISFFPKLLSGPIVQTGEFLRKKDGLALLNQGLFIFAIGLFKKVFIADFLLSGYAKVDPGMFELPILEAWITALSLTFFLYFDFSGYSDMAIGLAKMLGFEVPWNFNGPFKSKSLIEFWKRWHISLGNFVRTYFFTWLMRKSPGNFGMQMVFLFLTMVVLGVWHGASWNYLVFGALHGAGLVCNYVFRRQGRHLNAIFSVALTLIFVIITLVIFNTPDMASALSVLKGMGDVFSFDALYLQDSAGAVALMLAVLVLVLAAPSSMELAEKFQSHKKSLLITVLLVLISVLMLNHEPQFVYMGF